MAGNTAGRPRRLGLDLIDERCFDEGLVFLRYRVR
ncbi:hypothetical protein ABIB56_003567 [Glaciihabitans sp. UYNi722]